MRKFYHNSKSFLPVIALSMAISWPVYGQEQAPPVDQGPDQVEQAEPTDPAAETRSVADLLAERADLSMLAMLVKSVGLEVDLAGDGPFTILAPSNDALGLIDSETMQAYTENPELLRNLLLAHVISGSALKAADVGDMSVWATANGNEITFIKSEDGSVKVQDAMVIEADIQAANGVIHVIDHVLTFEASETE